jgi:hypothetical protein
VNRGDTRTFRFNKSGVYPYYCAYHVGMVGTIVVGNGKGPGPTAKDSGIVRIKSQPAAALAPLPDDPREDVRAGEMDLVPLIVIGAGLLAVGVVGVLLSVRTRIGRARIER